MNAAKSDSGSWSDRTRKNTIQLGFWTLAWVVTLAVATFGPIFAWQSAVLTTLAIIVNLTAGAGMIVANKNHLRGLDEMQQKIQLEAMALSLGVGLVAGLAYSTMASTNLVPFDADISHIVILMSFTYMAGILFGNRKYK
jgi:hypothetical protein